MKIKAIVSMIALAATGMAHATININGISGGAADTFVTVFNANASFTYNLGLDSALLATSQTTPLTFTLSNDSQWQSFLTKAGSAPLNWSVQSADIDNNITWTTAKIGQENKAGTTTGGARLNNNLDSNINFIGTFIQNANQQGTLFGSPDHANGSLVALPGTTGYWALDGANSAIGFTKTSNLVNSAAVSLFQFQDNIDDPYNAAAKYDWATTDNKVTLTSVGGVYTVSIAAAAVPEPEGVVLALVGLVGLFAAGARRRSV